MRDFRFAAAEYCERPGEDNRQDNGMDGAGPAPNDRQRRG